jgi:predicted AAA+ superfamily ATPase
MNYKTRALAAKLLSLTEHFPVVVVSGARQVGKSTLIERHFPEWERVVFDPVVDIGNARADPELFLRNHPAPLVLDEIQYCPELVPSLKRIVDADKRPGRYILTGSQQWSVLQSVAESLAGRAVFIDLEGFSLGEIARILPNANWLERYLDAPEAFLASKPERLPLRRTVNELLWRGWLPEADALPERVLPDFHAAYLRTYIERDVRLMLDAGDWQQFGRFVQLLAALTAQEVNHSHLGREIGVTPQTAKRWLSVLKATFQWHELPAWHGNMLKRISLRPKGYFADTGLACHLQSISSARTLSGHPLGGALFESAVTAEIRKRIAPMSMRPKLYHWRLHSGCEVDLILEHDGRLHPIEIKLNSRPKRKDARGLRTFREGHAGKPVAPGLIIAPVEAVEQITEDEYVVPWDLQ